MQNSHLKLQEIIWEITGRCENGCEYCGSKDAWNVPIDTEKIIKIAQNIAKFPPAEIDMSGGDPMLVFYETHKEITDILKEKGIKCKIIVNPKSLYKKGDTTSTNEKTISLYDWVGLSINTEKELELLNCLVPSCGPSWFPIQKSTIISNFNLQNIFLYGEIEEFVKKHNLMWQVQYTMYNNVNENQLAIYNNEKALAFFSSQISKSIANGIRVVVADNANCGGCGAGLHSIGILYNGDVVPCLSMRSWLDIKDVVVGNILGNEVCSDQFKENPLKYIWENRFNKYRFESFKCCKDHCGNKCVEIKLVKNKQKKNNAFEEELDLIPKTEPSYPPYRVILYGVTPGIVRVYGVVYPDQGTYMYACPGNWRETTSVYSVATPPSTCYGSTRDSKTITKNEDVENKDDANK